MTRFSYCGAETSPTFAGREREKEKREQKCNTTEHTATEANIQLHLYPESQTP